VCQTGSAGWVTGWARSRRRPRIDPGISRPGPRLVQGLHHDRRAITKDGCQVVPVKDGLVPPSDAPAFRTPFDTSFDTSFDTGKRRQRSYMIGLAGLQQGLIVCSEGEARPVVSPTRVSGKIVRTYGPAQAAVCPDIPDESAVGLRFRLWPQAKQAWRGEEDHR
jgi:hypothetical protein